MLTRSLIEHEPTSAARPAIVAVWMSFVAIEVQIMRFAGLLLCLLPLGGCSYTMHLTDADKHGGTVNFVTDWAQDDAFEKAKDHCRQYNRIARLGVTNLGSGTMTFFCEDPNAHPRTTFGGV